jgi:transcriptional regulator with XRE-family HTH domain
MTRRSHYKFKHKKLRTVRNQHLLTQQDFAEAAGLSPDTVSRIENGKHTPNPSTVKKFAGVLGISPQDLIEVEDPEEASS